MSLLVSLYIRDENNEIQFVEQDHSDELAGFESCRHNLYGSALSKELGLKILPALAVESSLYVRFEDFQNVKQEVELMLANLDLYAKEGIYRREYIEAKLNNILKAIKGAQKIKGEIVIW